jgi:hypothetical protein
MNNLHIRLPSGFFQEVPMSLLQGIDRRVDSEKWRGDERTKYADIQGRYPKNTLNYLARGPWEGEGYQAYIDREGYR